jgi:hypothetical protein
LFRHCHRSLPQYSTGSIKSKLFTQLNCLQMPQLIGVPPWGIRLIARPTLSQMFDRVI